MAGENNGAGVDVQSSSTASTSVGERPYVARTLRSRLLSRSSKASTSLTPSAQVCNKFEITSEDSTDGGNMITATNNSRSAPDETDFIRDGLAGMSFESQDGADSALEGIAASEDDGQGSGLQAANFKTVLSSSPKPSSGSRQPDTNIGEDYATQRQLGHGHGAVKASLDPNAMVYAPSPSWVSSGVSPFPIQEHQIGVTSNSFSFEPGMVSSPVRYSPSYGADPTMTTFHENGAPVASASFSAPPCANSWASITHPELTYQAYYLRSVGDKLPIEQTSIQPFQSSYDPSWSFPIQAKALPSVKNFGQFALPATGSHPLLLGKEHVSRAILLNGVTPSMSDEQLWTEMEEWGDVRAVVSDWKQEGLVIVSFYDIRCAQEALQDIQQQHLKKQERMMQQYQLSRKQTIGSSSESAAPGKGLVGGFVIWAQYYTLPIGGAAGPEGPNQGTLVVFNLDVDTTIEDLKPRLEVYGDIKELRDTPTKKHHRFVEFFDVRDAAKALVGINGTEIYGKRVKIEFSRRGGQADKARVHLQQSSGTTMYYPISGS